ncbi:hypothetical protein [Xenorhabdus thailandensis]|uniref:hypothetical protein n=1 Tax=Xenorhabdus thailandensis TaxID=3136255 RepID=UPI0030F4B341
MNPPVIRLKKSLCFLLLSIASYSHAADAKIIPAGKLNNMVLVHGAFVDASIGQDMIIDLQAVYKSVAVQLPVDFHTNDIRAIQQVFRQRNRANFVGWLLLWRDAC